MEIRTNGKTLPAFRLERAKWKGFLAEWATHHTTSLRMFRCECVFVGLSQPKYRSLRHVHAQCPSSCFEGSTGKASESQPFAEPRHKKQTCNSLLSVSRVSTALGSGTTVSPLTCSLVSTFDRSCQHALEKSDNKLCLQQCDAIVHYTWSMSG